MDEPLDTIEIPAFARVNDYVGLWSVSPLHFSALHLEARSIDLSAHISAASAQQAPIQSTMEKIPTTGGNSIALLRMTGILMKSKSSLGGSPTIMLRRDLRSALADPKVQGIILAIDSPGGTVAGTDDLAADVKAARKQKPVWAHIEDLGASAAYWVASQASRITANSPTALVGSIGTLQVIQDASGAAEKQGVKTLVFATGSLKGLGTPGTPVTEEQASHVQALVESVQGSFDEAVQKGRGLSNAQLAAVRHGGVLTATAALDAKLIDAIQPLGKVLSDFAKSAGPGKAGMTAADEMLAAMHEPDLLAALEAAEEDEEAEEERAAVVGTLPMIRRHGLPMVS